MKPLICTNELIEETLSILKKAGNRGSEGIALWLARRSDDETVQVGEVLEPAHRAAVDFFHIPPEGMSALMSHLRTTRTKLVAQVHSHPGHAFHSQADDEWAIIRHEGALSFVIPYFARNTSASTFLDQAALFRLNEQDSWLEVPRARFSEHMVVIP
ncbi:Mov34/MPN/PAD-1 family protein [Rhizobium leguminosarum]|uniref:Mov34/MPN/PAD-1 family protein n=1 Tax=Rhizobium leguminosarum TaxID=384 RepID=UPI000FEC58C0|nr:Mov34/MPN/PAD-1 family protein [Rhizobium leguminosarum]RWX24516.1 hypothetical protein EHI43_31980 [Rhizobium leguminosarum]